MHKTQGRIQRSSQNLSDQMLASGNNDKRVSLQDIAKELGISQTAVSFAINDRPGVSEQTKQKVKETAARMGWTPIYAAQALSSSKTMTVGFAPARSMDAFQTENFMLHFMAGIHASLSEQGYGLLFRPCASLQEEMDTYRSWAKAKRVDGVILVDLLAQDPRPALLHSLGLPAVLAGGPDPSNVVPSLSIDDSKTMRTILEHLSLLGHRRIAYLSGDGNLDYSKARAASFHEFAQDHNLQSDSVYFTNFDPSEAFEVTARLLTQDEPYTAFIYENEILATASMRSLIEIALSRAQQSDSGVKTEDNEILTRMPAVVSFEDSFICQAMYPSVTSVHRDAGLYGTKVANLLLKIFNGEVVSGNRRILTPKLIIRESTRPVGAQRPE
ncbi:LacI family transcriptional regulator [Bombiscardovia nodaiensis]|uniref:LacI family transcriptional regulator n=1 Tax=Bombiscardovia nodaiensis TaxID=2932181 RepID=A0ABN6SDG7_9BIFI|nr:LacI family transcriptional regulator [Bombiscardovia nodaiensis]